MTIEWLEGRFAVCRLLGMCPMDFSVPFTFVSTTDNEQSLVCPEEHIPKEADAVQHGFSMLRVCGTLDFSLIGVLAGITGALAKAGVSVFVISTYDTDYVLVREKQRGDAVRALAEAGYCEK